jgi:hypothetical protein
VAVLVTPRLHRGYVATVKQNLRAGRVQLQEADVVDEGRGSTFGPRMGLEESALLSSVRRTLHPDSIVQAVAHLRSGEPQRILRGLGTKEIAERSASFLPWSRPRYRGGRQRSSS